MRSRTGTRAVLASIVMILALGAGGCDHGSAGHPTLDTAPANPTALPTVTATVGGCAIAVSAVIDAKPTISIQGCAAAPATLQTTDILVGTGDTVQPGDSVTIQYVGIDWSTHKQVGSSSWDTGKLVELTKLGRNTTIAMGWDFGLVGARVGGRRLLVLPPDMAIGPAAGASAAADDDIVYAVDIISIGSIPAA